MNTLQRPLASGYGAVSTAEEVSRGVDLTGATAIVTGGYSGLGVATVEALAARGAHVVVPARDGERARFALQDVAGVDIRDMDLQDPASIDGFVAEFLDGGRPLRVLINSAGIMAAPLHRDDRGYESHFAVNHLGHFQLTTGLLPALRAAHGARVVSVSSLGHRYSPVHFDDVNFLHRAYEPMSAYGQSKTANSLFAVELDAREEHHEIRAFAVHPGSIAGTGLEKHIPTQQLIDAGFLDADGTPVRDPSRNMKTPEQGAATQVWCAVSPQLAGRGGVYCENCDVATLSDVDLSQTTLGDSQHLSGVAPHAVDPVAAAALWTLSEKMLTK